MFLLGERGKYPPFGVNGGGPAALNRFVYETDCGRAHAAAGLEGHRRQDPPRPEGAAGDAGRRRLRRSGDARSRRASPATCGSATSRAMPRAATTRWLRRAMARSMPPQRPRCVPHHERSAASSSASMSAARSPTCSCSTRRRGTFRTAKVPSRRGDEAQGFLNGLQRARRRGRDRLDRARHHRRHQHAAGAARPEDRRHHHARLPRRAGDAPPRPPPHLGPVGRFRPDRRPRHAPRGRRAHAGRRHDPHRGRRRRGPRGRAGSCSTRARRRVAIIFINAYANAENERRALRGAARGLAERIRHRLARGAVGNPRVRALLDRGAQRLSAAGRRLLHRQARSGARRAAIFRPAAHRAVERRHHVDRDRAQAAGAHRAVGSGRRRGRGRGARQGRGLRQSHHLRSRRHLVRRVGDRGRQGRRSRRRPRSISASSSARR